MEYDDNGFVIGGPVESKDWRGLCPNEPHGLTIAQGTIPPGILMLQNYMGEAACSQLTNECNAQAGEISKVGNGAYHETRAREISEERRSENIHPDDLSFDVTKLITNAWSGFIAPHYRVALESYEKPNILRYRTGGEYIPHADADFWDRDGKQWCRSVDRDLSLLIYINDDFEGGELVFPNFGFSLKPHAGLLLAFPSDHRYIHAAKPVTAGIRYAVVSWAKIKGTPKIETATRSDVTLF